MIYLPKPMLTGLAPFRDEARSELAAELIDELVLFRLLESRDDRDELATDPADPPGIGIFA